MLVSDILNPSYHGRKEWICDIGNNHAENGGLVPPKPLSKPAWVILQFLDSFSNFTAKIFFDGCCVVNDVRNGAERDSCSLGNVFHGDDVFKITRAGQLASPIRLGSRAAAF